MFAAPVQQIEVEPVGAEALQAAFAGRQRAIERRIPRIDLRNEKDFVALTGDSATGDGFRPAVGIHFSRVDERHAEFDAVAEAFGLAVGVGGVFAHAPGAEAKGRHFGAVRQGYGWQWVEIGGIGHGGSSEFRTGKYRGGAASARRWRSTPGKRENS